MNEYSKTEEKNIMDAVWQWVLDHSDFTADGQLFLKAHIGGKESFRKSIAFRMKGYTRNFLDETILDVRHNESLKKMAQNNLKKVEAQNRKIIQNRQNIFKRILNFLAPPQTK